MPLYYDEGFVMRYFKDLQDGIYAYEYGVVFPTSLVEITQAEYNMILTATLFVGVP